MGKRIMASNTLEKMDLVFGLKIEPKLEDQFLKLLLLLLSKS
jgi:hypothetical protein